LLYSSSSYGQGWNGQYHGQPQEIGSYVYTIQYTHPITKQQQLLKGDISLIR
jgi:hypothetical protein